MTKMQAVQHLVGCTSAYRRRVVVKSNVNIHNQMGRICSPNLISKKKNGPKKNKSLLHHVLGYYGAKKMSVVVHCVALIILSITIAMETENYRLHPIATSVEDDMYPVQKIDFPGVSICSMNVISRKEAMNFAETLWLKESVQQIGNLTLDTVKYLVRFLGSLYQFDVSESKSDKLMLLHEILQKAFTKNYNIMGIMKMLTPQCRTFLADCRWQGSYRKCHELFTPRWTSEGYCCSFNHVRWNNRFNGDDDAGFKINVERSTILGSEYGLFIFLRPHLDDYYYTLIPGRGFRVLFYTASDYPDAPSGGLKEVLISPGSESFITIKATSLYSSSEVKKYDKSKRKCLFNTELDDVYGGSYSYSQCMMLCRVADVRKSCGCIPFFYPIPDDKSGVRICNIKDLACLDRLKYKWWTSDRTLNKNSDQSSLNSSEDKTRSNLQCDCWPSCENVDYNVYKSSSQIHMASVTWKGCSNANASNDDMVVNISFEGTGTVRLRQDVMFYWYDLMSNYGGLCSLFLGISIMTPIELIFLLCSRLWLRMKRRKLSQEQCLPAAPIKMMNHDQPIYWSELRQPKRPI